MRLPPVLPIVLTSVVLGCGSEDTVPEEPTSTAGCEDPLAIAHTDGSCTRPGVPVDGCGTGFVHDGEYGCEPVLPAESCPPGTMAIVGETACRPVMPCVDGKWGDIVRDATTQHVDGAFVGTSDGTEQQPWTTIAEAVAAAAPGAVVAVTDGSYLETVEIAGKPVQLRGVCPDRVGIVAPAFGQTGCPSSGLCILGAPASGTSVSGFSVSGAGVGVLITGATGVVLEGLRVFDNPTRGINLQDDLGPTAAEVRGVLLEGNVEFGIYVGGSTLSLTGSLVRDTQPRAGALGNGLMLSRTCITTSNGLECNLAARSSGVVTSSVFERNHGAGVTAIASDLVLEDAVIRQTMAEPGTGTGGYGIGAWAHCDEPVTGCDAGTRATAAVRGSVLTDNQDASVYVSGAEVSLDRTVVARTQPRALDASSGRGLNVQPPCGVNAAGAFVCVNDVSPIASVTASLVEDNYGSAIFLGGGEITIDGTVVRNTLSRLSDQLAGRGMNLQPGCLPGPTGNSVCDEGAFAAATVTNTLVADNQSIGVFVGGATVDVVGSVVRNTTPRALDGVFGDGIAYANLGGLVASGEVVDVVVEDSARAGVASFGAPIRLKDTTIRCAAFALNGEDEAVIVDDGGNLCGCPQANETCKLVTAGLEPPTSIPD